MVAFDYYAALEDWLEANRANENLPIIALEQAAHSVPLASFQPPHAFALLLGEEVEGIASHYLSQCDAIVEIPMRGNKESFNVSVAAGIALFALS